MFAELRRRTLYRDHATESTVREILEDVRARGDAALLESARTFDSPTLDAITVSDQEWDEARVRPDHLEAIREAIRRVKEYHAFQLGSIVGGWTIERGRYVWTTRDGQLGQRWVAVDRAGVYVPGGQAAYPSSVIMNAVPAAIAGVGETIITTPARRDGTLPAAVLVAADHAGVRSVFKVGGAAAVAALAYGTESVPKVDKIVGPGNRFVNEAKRQVWGQVGLDGYAGPSEVCVLIDATSNPVHAATDLLTQVEHAPDNAGFLVATDESALAATLAEVARQLAGAPRADILRQALAEASLAVLARDLDEACDVVNAIAPEHLTLAVEDPDEALRRVRHAGCILMGEWSPESAGDFAAGPSHTLPTSGAARFDSPVNVMSFLRAQSLIRLDEATFRQLAPVIEAFGEMEGFPAHAYGAAVRKENPSDRGSEG